jgi:hypothetical protein
MADIEARVNENSPIGFFTWCWTIVVEITDGRIGSIGDTNRAAFAHERTIVCANQSREAFSLPATLSSPTLEDLR